MSVTNSTGTGVNNEGGLSQARALAIILTAKFRGPTYYQEQFSHELKGGMTSEDAQDKVLEMLTTDVTSAIAKLHDKVPELCVELGYEGGMTVTPAIVDWINVDKVQPLTVADGDGTLPMPSETFMATWVCNSLIAEMLKTEKALLEPSNMVK